MKPENKSKGLVPGLRFPEFRDAGEWEERQLSHLTTKISDGIHTTPVYDKNGEYAFINGNNLVHGRILIDEKTKRVNLGEFNKHKKPLDENSILMSINGTIGNLAFFRGEQVILGKSACFIKIDSRLANKFLIYNMLQTEKVKHLFTSELTGSTIKNLSLATIKNIALRVPTLPEQQKIADCLSSLDELITTQAQKIDTLKAHKKGLMQKLFPAEGETVPGLRFPEFRDAGEWEICQLGKFIEEFRENSCIQDEFEVLTSARSGLVRQREYYDNERITERDNVGFNIIPPKYITYRSRSDDRRFYFNENNLGLTGVISTYYPVFRILGGDNKFFIELLTRFSEIVGKFSVGTSQTVLSMNNLKRLKLPVPLEAEQQKIADCLSSLDELITAEVQKIDTLKAHKKGLMQGLFPSADEVGV